MNIGDLVRFKDPDHPYKISYMKETGIVTGWQSAQKSSTHDGSGHPIVCFPSCVKTFLEEALVVVNENR